MLTEWWVPQAQVNVAADGSFLAIWEWFDFYSRFTSTVARRFSDSNAQVGIAFPLTSLPPGGSPGTPRNPYTRVATAPSGERLAVWQDHVMFWDEYQEGVVMSGRFQADGTPIGAAFQVNTVNPAVLATPSVAMHADGSAVVVWQTLIDIKGQRLDASGNPVGGEFHVGDGAVDLTSGSVNPAPLRAHVAVQPSVTFVVVWTSQSPWIGTDTSGSFVRARRFEPGRGGVSPVSE